MLEYPKALSTIYIRQNLKDNIFQELLNSHVNGQSAGNIAFCFKKPLKMAFPLRLPPLGG